MTDRNVSIRKRFLAIILVFFSLFLLFALYTDQAARETVEDSEFQIRQMQEMSLAVGDITNTLHQLGIAMYQATLFDGNDQPQIIQLQLEVLAGQITRLINFPSVKSNPQFYQPALTLSHNLTTLTIQANKMLEINDNVKMKYPAMSIVKEKLQPIDWEMVGLITGAIDAAREELNANVDQKKILALFWDVRYEWAQLVGSVRVFVANRLGAFGSPDATISLVTHDRQSYIESINDLLFQLKEIEDNAGPGLLIPGSLERMRKLHRDYQQYLADAEKIYLSENWRADKILLRDELDPSLALARQLIYLISNRVDAYSQLSMGKYADTADKFSNYIWAAVLTTFALLVMGYLTFEYLIRRPIIDIAEALEAEGSGDYRAPELNFRVTEINVLLSAFKDMKYQVRSRQARLESILNNAGEGIVTVSPTGKIEGANKAACFLFGFDETELIHQDATQIIPNFSTLLHQRKLTQLIGSNPERERILPGEQEVLGRCKDGRLFPMSIRLGKAVIEGDKLYTALVSDISERKVMIERLTQLAERDSLTGLYNRHFLMDELDRIVDRSSRGEKQNVALLYIDLDHFKFVNDTLGHIAGDNVLREVATILEKRARGTDLVTRLGGDEFAVLLYDVDELQAKSTASAYRKQLAEYTFKYEGKTVDIGCSIGIVMNDEYISKKEQLLSQADLACHLAKQGGRNSVRLYASEDRHDVNLPSADSGWSQRIKRAIDNDEFYQHIQPIVNVITGETLSNEVLLRLKDNENEFIMPSGFLPAAERFGLSVELDQWVIKNSFKLLSEQSGPGFAGYSINLLPQTIESKATLPFIEKQLSVFDVNPHDVVFEVAESSAINSQVQSVAFLKALHALGFKTLLDDFGAGYASFAYMKDFPVDYVKFGHSFVQDLGNDRVKAAIVRAMNEVAHALGKKTIAGHVEDARTLAVLRKIGIDYCQGFYTGRPVEVPDKLSNIHYLKRSR